LAVVGGGKLHNLRLYAQPQVKMMERRCS
jgi:hypothetical protein